MKPLLVDTKANSAFMRGAPAIVETLAFAEWLYLNAVVLGELLGGFAAGARDAANRAELSRFLASPRAALPPLTAKTADP